MQFDWSLLGRVAPTALVRARNFAHQAVQWPARAAHVNLAAASDDSHSSLTWDAAHAALFSLPLPGEVRVGLRLRGLALMILRGDTVLDTFELLGRRESTIGVWFDSALRALGLKAASDAELPYTLPAHSVARGGAYTCSGEAAAFEELAGWYGAAAAMLAEVQTQLAGVHPGPGPVRCWPHHFDIATLVRLEDAEKERKSAETARSIGIGLSPGDGFYPQPYVYVSPWPRFDAAGLPDPPRPGQWHSEGFFAAVATGAAILTLEDRGPGLLAFVSDAVEIGRVRLGI